MNQQNKTKKFKGMGYRQVQRLNSNNRNKLEQKEQKLLKIQGFKNIGWNFVIALYNKLEQLLDRHKFDNFTLEELFLEADRIGNKYQTDGEIAQFNHQLAQEANEIAQQIEQQFPDTDPDIIDFSNNFKPKYRRNRHQKTYKTIKI